MPNRTPQFPLEFILQAQDQAPSIFWLPHSKVV